MYVTAGSSGISYFGGNAPIWSRCGVRADLVTHVPTEHIEFFEQLHRDLISVQY